MYPIIFFTSKGNFETEIIDTNSISAVNRILDTYNDYILLHKLFGDEEYLQIAQFTLGQLKQISI